MFLKKYLIVIIAIILIVTLTVFRAYCLFEFYSDSILAITALIILWYTFETAEIRKSEYTIAKITEENQMRLRNPSINCSIFTHPNDSTDTIVGLSNLSNYPVAVRLNCNIKIEGNIINFSPAYNGQQFWNLQYNEVKEGHFSWLDLFKCKGLISQQELDEIKNLSINYKLVKAKELLNNLTNTSLPQISMDVEIFCINEFKLSTYYPPTHYDYDYKRKVWIPILASDKPYWEFASKPLWVNTNNKA